VPATEVERAIDLDAPTEAVWSALTEDDALSHWFGGPVELDVVPGGGGRFEGDGGEVRRALVEEVEAERRLSFRWWAEDDDDGPVSTVTFELTEVAGATRLVVTERALLLGCGLRASASLGVATQGGCHRLQARFVLLCRV
jgi:uncharacterized protein YndB with AHSA1/START domain